MRNRVGKTAIPVGSPSFDLNIYDKVRIEPVVPAGQFVWISQSTSDGNPLFHKESSGCTIEIPTSLIEKVHRFSGSTPALVQLAGRLQWISVGQRW